MEFKRFEKLVNEGIKAIPRGFMEKLTNVGIVIEDEPTLEQLRELRIRKHSLLFGLYEGVPQTKRYHYGQVLPDKITIFKKSIERAASSEEEIKEIVKNTVWHEIAHHFGMDEKRIREAEVNRQRAGRHLI